MSFIRRTFSTKDGSISYLHWENRPGAPTLVFSHATGFNAQTYQRLLGAVAPHFQIFALDARGHGFSSVPANPELYKGWCIHWADLLSFLSPSGPVPPGPIYLVGHSMGGVVSLEASLELGARVDGLVLIEPSMPPPVNLAMFGIMKLLGLADGAAFVKKAANRRPTWPNRQQMLEAYRGKKIFKGWSDGWLEDYVDGGTRQGEDGQLHLACTPSWEAKTFALTAAVTWQSLRHVKAKTLILSGQKSDVFPKRSVSMTPAWQKVKVVPGATHFLPMENPDRVAWELLEFAGVPAPS